jgi:hypothetical protein
MEVCCFITNLLQKDAKYGATFMPLNLIQLQGQKVLSSENSEISTVISDYDLQSCRERKFLVFAIAKDGS